MSQIDPNAARPVVPFASRTTATRRDSMDTELARAWRPFLGGLAGLPLLLLGALPAHAQPSGGPYGPVPQTYPVPANAAHVYYVAPDGRAEAAGTSLAEPTTLESAIERVVTGDAVVLRGGTYRTGGLEFNQGITLQPHADEHPVLKGTRVATEWKAGERQRLAHAVEDALPGLAARLVAARPRGHAHAAAPLQQRHGVRRRRAAEVGRLGGRARRALLLHRLRQGAGLHRDRPREPAGRDHGLRRRARAHDAAGARQDERPQGAA